MFLFDLTPAIVINFMNFIKIFDNKNIRYRRNSKIFYL